jgi:cation diffusion facilitator family transporter
MNQDSCEKHFLKFDKNIETNAKKAATVLLITFVTMIAEIYFGYTTGSMALLADGWHMATHAAALGITYVTYRVATNPRMTKKFNFGGGKIIALGGFASSVFLLCVVLLIGFEAIEKLFHPIVIAYNEALIVAVIGLLINVICAFILRDSHTHSHSDAHSHSHSHSHDHAYSHESAHDHSHDETHGHEDQDHNIRGAYIHVLADAVTSVSAILALLAAKFYSVSFLDPLMGLIGSMVILRWAFRLIQDTGWELLDGHALNVDFKKLKQSLELNEAKIVDLHVWKIAPNMLACELVILSKNFVGIEHYREILHSEFHIDHTIIEERIAK